MTEGSLKANLAAEAERGDAAMQAADKLIAVDLPYDAASRAYYAAFHYARALCLALGEEPRSHHGVAHLLSLHYVRAGIFPAETSRDYALLQRFRESADYDAAFVLDRAGALEAVERTDVRRPSARASGVPGTAVAVSRGRSGSGAGRGRSPPKVGRPPRTGG